MIGFRRTQPTKEEDEQLFARIVNELTGNFIHHVECDSILKPRYAKNPKGEMIVYNDEVVYFGPKEDLNRDADAEDV